MVPEAEVRSWCFALEQEVVKALTPHVSLRAVINAPFALTFPASEAWTKSLRNANQTIVSGMIK